ncbi:MAG TPA: peptidoglycan-binding protein [Methylorubrum populi]|uniref:Peptidoglycan-binding protein n=1 Tax=Methylorubrum populi TaxID=223967 RepID=A0A921DZ51_9HYPH|nr:peptidoglycan-binding protein [Methylorubrum populi]
MRETPARRDQREIVVPGDMRAPRSPARPRKAAPRRPAASGWKAGALAALSGAGQLCRRNPGGVFGTVIGVAAAAYVCVNAMGLQDGRHPAPILPTVEPKPVAVRPAPPPVREIRTAEASKPAPVREVPVAPRDPIADMIRSGETTASVTPRPERKPDKTSAKEPKAETAKVEAKPEAPKPDPAIIRVQRALAKLGYGPLKDDGLMGPGTKAAIEKFERDRKLPVKGEAAGPTLRALTREMTAKAGAQG